MSSLPTLPSPPDARTDTAPRAGRGRAVGGALAVALAQAPESAAYGLMALAPLGPALGPAAMAMALLGVVVANAVALVCGAGSLVTAPRAALSLLTATLLGQLAQAVPGQAPPSPALLLALLALGLVAAGVLQVVFGLLRLGSLVKYTPHPVRMGLMAGVGLVLALRAGPTLLGQPLGGDWQAAWLGLRPGALLVGGVSMAVLAAATRWRSRVPPVLLALLAGTGLHLVLAWLGLATGPVAGVPALAQPWAFTLGDAGGPWAWLQQAWWSASALAGFAATVAVLGALDTLLATSVMDGRLRQVRDANRELRAQGLANVASALVGGLPNSPSVQRSLALWQAWPAPRAALGVYALAQAALLLLLPQLLGWLPVAAIGGVLVLQGLQTVDRWLWRAPQALWLAAPPLPARQLSGAQRRLLLDSWGVAALVVSSSLALGLAAAVLVGAALSVMLFVRSNMRGVVRGLQRGDCRRSLTVRSPGDSALLRTHGARIAVLELQGALFFGTADSLRERLQALAAGLDCAVLDLLLVAEVDATGARILLELAEDWARRGKHLVAAEWPEGDARRGVVEAIGRSSELPALQFVADADQALEQAEDRLLHALGAGQDDTALLTLADTALARGLGADDLALLQQRMPQLEFAAGTRLFAAGDPAHALYVSLRGRIGVRLPGGQRRLASFAPGVMVGELAVIEQGNRSADAVAETAVTVRMLSVQALAQLQQEHPLLAAQLMRNVALHLAGRLRSLTQELSAWVGRSAAPVPLDAAVVAPPQDDETTQGV